WLVIAVWKVSWNSSLASSARALLPYIFSITRDGTLPGRKPGTRAFLPRLRSLSSRRGPTSDQGTLTRTRHSTGVICSIWLSMAETRPYNKRPRVKLVPRGRAGSRAGPRSHAFQGGEQVRAQVVEIFDADAEPDQALADAEGDPALGALIVEAHQRGLFDQA